MLYHLAMERTQISLEPEQADRLRRLARRARRLDGPPDPRRRRPDVRQRPGPHAGRAVRAGHVRGRLRALGPGRRLGTTTMTISTRSTARDRVRRHLGLLRPPRR